MSDIVLHGYWRSSATYRVRIALNLKSIVYHQVTYDLRTGAQKCPLFLSLLPQGLVPAIESNDMVLTQSPAILEWVEEQWPSPPLLPTNIRCRAMVRSMAALIGCDIHPLNNLRVLNALKSDFNASQQQVDEWIARWIVGGFAALELLVQRHGDGFCYGNVPSFADCYLVPQIYSARRFGVDLSPYSALNAVANAMERLPPVQAAHPSQQPDA
ncbi:maleylpyruvate isomerase [Sphingobium sp. AP50]|uniref:maleylacetoacetate isomerase n=1 Tax=Sphingobium sp. AP50 TaxID=1884369 RepID=UPI0008D008B7|nr:maleylacetoacetate isomerase [Sphingobium sp. AP50]SEJ98441.1 maleylpyruvate isomerase [Sphingobium sp. AP50]